MKPSTGYLIPRTSAKDLKALNSLQTRLNPSAGYKNHELNVSDVRPNI